MIRNNTKETSQKILDYIGSKVQASGNELAEVLEITPRAVRKQLKTLLDKGFLQKIGRPPKVFYLLNSRSDKSTPAILINKKFQKIINQRYLYITPTGDEIDGLEGFLEWCIKTNQNPEKTAADYIKTLNKYDAFRKNGRINGMEKMKKTFDKVYIDVLFYLDFYSIERFGKTKLGQILLYAKQSQNKRLMKKLIDDIRPHIISLMYDYQIDGVLFVPPTVKRETQFMNELEKNLQLTQKSLKVTKVKTPIAIPQKTLTKLEDRILNARQTIIIEDTHVYNNILLIDDAVGSGATFNEIARQIKQKAICKGKIIGLAITGSFKGFDVISEV